MFFFLEFSAARSKEVHGQHPKKHKPDVAEFVRDGKASDANFKRAENPAQVDQGG